jgi:hypothetical protein
MTPSHGDCQIRADRRAPPRTRGGTRDRLTGQPSVNGTAAHARRDRNRGEDGALIAGGMSRGST